MALNPFTARIFEPYRTFGWLFRRSPFTALSVLAHQGLQAVGAVLAARWLGAAGYGDFATIAAMFGWFSLVANYATHVALARSLAEVVDLLARKP